VIGARAPSAERRALHAPDGGAVADRFACSITPAALDDPRPQRKHDRGPPGRAWLASFAGTALTEGSIRQQGRLRAELAGEPRTPGQRRARRSQRLRTPTSACAARRALGGPSARTRRHATAPARAHVASDCASSARRGSASRARGARRGGGASAPQPSAAAEPAACSPFQDVLKSHQLTAQIAGREKLTCGLRIDLRRRA